MKGKLLVKHTLISRKHVTKSSEDFLVSEYRSGFMLTCDRGDSIQGVSPDVRG
jgi:hypothetical protein